MKITIQSKQYKVYGYLGFVRAKNAYGAVVLINDAPWVRTAMRLVGEQEWQWYKDDLTATNEN